MRMDPRLIEVSNLKIEYDSDLLKAKPGKKIRVPVNVTNYGETVSAFVNNFRYIQNFKFFNFYFKLKVILNNDV